MTGQPLNFYENLAERYQCDGIIPHSQLRCFQNHDGRSIIIIMKLTLEKEKVTAFCILLFLSLNSTLFSEKYALFNLQLLTEVV